MKLLPFYVWMLSYFRKVECEMDWNWETAPEWSFQVYEGDNVTLRCNDTDTMLQDSNEVEYWKLPTGGEIHGKSFRVTEKHRLMYDDGLMGGILEIYNVTSIDSGLYFCFVLKNNTMIKVNRAINLHGPLERDHFKMYRTNVITGSVAASVFCCSLIFLCIVYKFRYKSPSEKRTNRQVRNYYRNRNKAIETNDITFTMQYPGVSPRYDFENEAYVDTHL